MAGKPEAVVAVLDGVVGAALAIGGVLVHVAREGCGGHGAAHGGDGGRGGGGAGGGGRCCGVDAVGAGAGKIDSGGVSEDEYGLIGVAAAHCEGR